MKTNLASIVAVVGLLAGASEASAQDAPSVAYRNAESKRFEVPPETVLREMAVRAVAEGGGAASLMELDAGTLREEAVAVRAGGVRLRLRGGLRSALVMEEKEGARALSCEEAMGGPAPLATGPSASSGEVHP